MSALVKVHEHEKRKKYRNIYGSYALAILDHIPKRRELTERFNNLFGTNTKKSLHAVLICAIILLSNVSLVFAAQKISPYNEINEGQAELSTRAPQTNLNITVHNSFSRLKMGEKGHQDPSNVNYYIFFSKKDPYIHGYPFPPSTPYSLHPNPRQPLFPNSDDPDEISQG